LRFLYVKTLGRDELDLKLPRCRREQKLPEVLSGEEVERVLTALSNPKHRALLMTTYAAGLRVGEVVRLQLTDINSARMVIHVRQGKGYKDRFTLLSRRLLDELRAYWKIERPPIWLFPGQDPKTHLNRATAGKIYQQAKRDAGVKRRGGIHTLRHCFATHLLESGVDPRTLQILLGHRSLKTTVRYLQVTRDHALSVRSPLDLLALPNSPRR
jgi:site-specific recombinase XerD